MADRVQLIAEAREWIGTRWHHQASVKGVGCDCIGLVRGAAKNVGLLVDVEEREDLLEFHGYGRASYDGRLERGLTTMLGQSFPFTQAKPGDVFMMRVGGAPRHIGFITMMPTGSLGILHSYVPARRVVETHLDDTFRDAIVACYSIPGIEE